MKKFAAFLLALIMMLSLAACGTKQEPTVSDAPVERDTTAAAENAAPATDVVRGGSLKIAKTMDMTNNGFAMFHSTYTQADAYVLDQILETPIKIDADGNFVPSLAESWEFTEDGLGLKLKLRSDVTFSNGTPLTAQGVADLYNYYITEECGHKQKGSDLALITGTDVIDENTIQINTSSPDAGLLTALSGISFYVYAPENLANDDFAANPIGTGPFVLKEYKEGDHITLARRDDYYLMGEDGQPLPYLDEIYYQILPDDAAKVANLQSGDIDGIDLQSSSNSTITCMSNADLTTYQHHYNINFWAGFNFGNEALAKLEVRQAVAYAIDRQEIVDVVFEGLATTTPFFARADQYWYYDNAGINEYNPEKAKELLAEAGYPNGLSISVSCISREPDNTILQLMQSQMKQAGIDLVLNPMERTAWIECAKTSLDYDMIVGQNGNAGVDMSRQLKDPFVAYMTLDIPEAVESQEMYNKLKTITDIDARVTALKELQDHFHANTLKLMICQSNSYGCFANYVKNVEVTNFGSYSFAGTYITK